MVLRRFGWHLILIVKFNNPFKSATERLISEEAENSLFEKAANDMENQVIDKGIWTKAFAKANGDEVKQKAIYIELIVQHYKNQIEAGEEIAHILATEEEKRIRSALPKRFAKGTKPTPPRSCGNLESTELSRLSPIKKK